jgi:phosphoserine aminotransferase
MNKPAMRPLNPNFSCGPCAKRPGWTPAALEGALLGRSHRSSEGRARLKRAIDMTRDILGLPGDYLVAIVPASDTGAFEMAMWNLLGTRGVDGLAWESFGRIWLTDMVQQLRLADARTMEAPFGHLPDLSKVDFSRDVMFTANGTTSGVKVPDYDWIPHDRAGLTLVDATSAIFAQPIDWPKADVVTYSWQKVLGGEAAHGMLILSPRAVERIETTTPPWPLPKLFRMTRQGKLDRAIFEGETINTPSMLCVEDYIDALAWAQRSGGLAGLMARADANAKVLYDWVARTSWVAPLAVDPATYSNTSICLRVVDEAITSQPLDAQAAFAKRIVARLEAEGVAYDIGAYRDAPPGLRIWTGATVEKSNLSALTPWLDWAFEIELSAQTSAEPKATLGRRA